MLLTIPVTPLRNEPQPYTLDVSDLIDLVNSAYYEDQANWRKVIVAYKSIDGNQLNLISYIPDGSDTLTTDGFFAPECFTRFEIQNISIIDKQNGTYIINSSEIPNVSNYNIVFITGGDGFVSLYGTSDNKLAVSGDGSKFIYAQNGTTHIGAISYAYGVMNEVSSEMDSQLSAFINNIKVFSYYFNSDNSVVYIVGELGTSYLGESLPAIPSGPTYSTTTSLRFISINTISNEVTFLSDIENAGATYGNFGTRCWYLYVPEGSNTAVMVGDAAIAGYNIVTGTREWFRVANFVSAANRPLTSSKIDSFNSTSFVVSYLSNYNGEVFSYVRPIQINLATGLRDVSFPTAPQNGANNNSIFWSITPDKTKLVIFANQARFFVYENGAWSSLRQYIPSPTFNLSAMTTDNEFIYAGFKCDFLGNQSLGFTTTVNNLGYDSAVVTDNYLFFGSNRFNKITGIADPAFKGVSSPSNYVLILRASNGKIYIRNSINSASTMSDYSFYTPINPSQNSAITVFDTETRAKISSTTIVQPGQNQSNTIVFGTDDSNVYFVIQYQGAILRTFNVSDSSLNTTYPTIDPTARFGCLGRDGEYLYISIGNSSTSNTFNITDSLGSAALVTKVCRLNITTKIVDRSFLPNIAGAFGGTSKFSFTDDYVYISVFGGTPSRAYRINKTTQATQEILPSTLGLSGPATWPNGRLQFARIAPNRLVVFGDQSTDQDPLKFDGRPYVIVSEDTLSQSGISQPAENPKRGYMTLYNPIKNEVAGLYRASAGYPYYSLIGSYWVSFSMVDNSESVNISILSGVRQQISGNYIAYGFNRNLFAFENIGADYLFASPGTPIVQNFKPYSGVLRFNPVGIINNE